MEQIDGAGNSIRYIQLVNIVTGEVEIVFIRGE